MDESGHKIGEVTPATATWFAARTRRTQADGGDGKTLATPSGSAPGDNVVNLGPRRWADRPDCGGAEPLPLPEPEGGGRAGRSLTSIFAPIQ